MNVCLVAVCHNTYEESIKFLSSIDEAIRDTGIKLDVFFVDNSLKVDMDMVNKIKGLVVDFCIHYVVSENLGYFPSVIAAIKNQKIEISNYPYLIISNVDLTVSKHFFSELENLPADDTVGVYAPSIVSSVLNLDQNPKITVRPSSFKLQINRFCFRSRFAYAFLYYVNMLRLKVREMSKLGIQRPHGLTVGRRRKIYAGHGSFIVLTNRLLQSVPELNYPIFLFGEELYIAETARKSDLDVIYAPNLIVFDAEHASTSAMKRDAYRASNVLALNYILSTYKF